MHAPRPPRGTHGHGFEGDVLTPPVLTPADASRKGGESGVGQEGAAVEERGRDEPCERQGGQSL